MQKKNRIQLLYIIRLTIEQIRIKVVNLKLVVDILQKSYNNRQTKFEKLILKSFENYI